MNDVKSQGAWTPLGKHNVCKPNAEARNWAFPVRFPPLGTLEIFYLSI